MVVVEEEEEEEAVGEIPEELAELELAGDLLGDNKAEPETEETAAAATVETVVDGRTLASSRLKSLSVVGRIGPRRSRASD